jgi:4'-phosphopantetheinyl transferase
LEVAAVRCANGEVHVWRIDLDLPAITLKMLDAVLSAEERERVVDFRSMEMRKRWVVARGALRCILATYTSAKPSSLVFQVERYGKPYISWPANNIPFNFSHTGNLALLAISNTGQVGVNAEQLQSNIDIEKISRRFFATSEADEIMALTPEARPSAFFACWTRKEAFVKALGKGLNMPVDQFRVTVRAEETPRLLSVNWCESSTWSFADLGEPNFAATVAVQGPAPAIRRFNFPMSLGGSQLES